MDIITIAAIVFFLFIEMIVIIITLFLISKGGLWSLVLLRLKGGSLVVKSDADQSVSFKRYKIAPQTVPFRSIDKMGIKKDYMVQIPRVKHMLNGTSHPIHFCAFNNQENINLNEKEQTDFSVKQWNEFAVSNYEAGWNARGILQRNKPFDIQTVMMILMVVMVLLLAFNFWLTYNVLGAVAP